MDPTHGHLGAMESARSEIVLACARSRSTSRCDFIRRSSTLRHVDGEALVAVVVGRRRAGGAGGAVSAAVEAARAVAAAVMTLRVTPRSGRCGDGLLLCAPLIGQVCVEQERCLRDLRQRREPRRVARPHARDPACARHLNQLDLAQDHTGADEFSRAFEYNVSSAGRRRACVLGQSAVGLTLLLTPNSVATDECCSSEV